MMCIPKRLIGTDRLCGKCVKCKIDCAHGALDRSNHTFDFKVCDSCGRLEKCRSKCNEKAVRFSSRRCREGAPGNGIVCIFSCPTTKEDFARTPIAGETGSNFKKLVDELKAKGIQINENEVCILNASAEVHNSRDDHPKVSSKEIGSNVDFLAKYVFSADIHAVICFGDDAAKAWRMLLKRKPFECCQKGSYLDLIVIKVQHLSPTSLNKILPGEPKQRKIQVVANYIYQAFNTRTALMEYKDYICAYTNSQLRNKGE